LAVEAGMRAVARTSVALAAVAFASVAVAGERAAGVGPGVWGTTVTLGAGWGEPLGWNGSMSFLVGPKYVRDDAGSHSVMVFPGYSGQGLLIQLQPGIRAGKVSLGYGRTSTVFFPSLSASEAVSLAFLQGWSDGVALERGQQAVGVELQAGVVVKFSLGAYRKLGRDHGGLLQVGLGVGF
jgi:hypothetical protein